MDPEAGAVRGGGRAADGGPGGPLPFDARLRVAVDAYLSDEGVTARLRRERRAAGRVGAMVWVPPVGAPEHAAPGRVDRFGRAHRAGGGRRRSRVPMRAVIALWAHGFGADAVAAMVAQAGVETSSSAIGRVFTQAGAMFEGAEAVRAGDLVIERPLPDGHAARALAERMRRWRERHQLTKGRAARLAGVGPAVWRRLERGEPARRVASVEAVIRVIEGLGKA